MPIFARLFTPRKLAITAAIAGGATFLCLKCNVHQATTNRNNKFTPSADYPDLTKHNNVMAECLTPEVEYKGAFRE